MAWPQSQEYREVIQTPRLCFSDPELRQGQPVCDRLGLPRPRSGNFADVYAVRCLSSGQTWAVKCFTREVPGLRERYRHISTYLQQVNLPFTVDFQYLDQGIRIQGRWYPVLKMAWVEGLTLNEFVKHTLDNLLTLDALAQVWVWLAQKLREAHMAHADLQHGNVLLVAGTTRGAPELKLIDYDGLFVPALARQRSGEDGHANYQHPQRLRDGTYNAEVDRFSNLVICTALRCLAVAGRGLWDRYDNGENLLFRENDFKAPGQSALFQELWRLGYAEARALVGHLVLATQGPLERVPLVQELLANGQVRRLDTAQEQQVQAVLTAGAKQVHQGPKLHPSWVPVPGAAGSSAAQPSARQSPASPSPPAPPTFPPRWPSRATRATAPVRPAPTQTFLRPNVLGCGVLVMALTLLVVVIWRSVSQSGLEGKGQPVVNPPLAVTSKGPEPKEVDRLAAGMKFVRVPKGIFWMGWDSDKRESKRVEIKEVFELAAHTVTQEQWRAVMGNNPSRFSRQGQYQDEVKDIADADFKLFPVESVSWDDVQEFLKKLNEREKGRGWWYRLPSEAEWEYACRGGATSKEECSFDFYFDKPTNGLSSKQANFRGDFPAGRAEEGPNLGRPTMVGSYLPNKLGLYDMHGNVWQWCDDLYEGGPARVVRGGSWSSHGQRCRAADRDRDAPENRSRDLGLRVARVPSGNK
jgi:formylglycine-generating enzyme required for sulfatase activity